MSKLRRVCSLRRLADHRLNCFPPGRRDHPPVSRRNGPRVQTRLAKFSPTRRRRQWEALLRLRPNDWRFRPSVVSSSHIRVFAGRGMIPMRCLVHSFHITSERIAMTILSVRSGSTRFHFRKPFSRFAWRRLPRRAGRAVLRALHESRKRAAAKVLQEYAHLNAANRSVPTERSTPQQ